MRSVEKSRGNKVDLPFDEVINHKIFKRGLSMIFSTLESAELGAFIKVKANHEYAKDAIKKLKA